MSFAESWRAGAVFHGLLLPVPSTFAVEIAGVTDFDFVVLDTEHSIGDQLVLQQHILAAHAAGMAALVRIHRAELRAASRLLDLGADGVMVPDVRSETDAGNVVDALRFPPLGHRGFGSLSSAGGWGSGGARLLLDQVVVIAMLETEEAIGNASDIAAVDGIDGVFVGRADLAVSMGLGTDPSHEAVRSAISRVRRVAGARVVDADPATLAEPGIVRLHNGVRIVADALRTARRT